MSDTENPAQNGGQVLSNQPGGEEDTQTLIGPARKRTDKVALVHGLYASDIILPWESEEEFQRLFRELKEEWLPHGRQEFETLLSLARLNWLKHRLMRSTQIAFRRDPLVAELEKSGAKTWSAVSQFMDEKAEADDDLMTEAKATLKELKDATKHASALMTASNPDTQKIYRAIETVNDLYSKTIMSVYQKVFDKLYRKKPDVDMNEPGVRFADAYSLNPSTLVEQAYHPDYLEKLVRLEASIDARIDKLLQRLMSLKEYKRIVRESRPIKNISSPSIAPAATADEN
jgi:hypothetical protein